MSFEEYLIANGANNLFNYLEKEDIQEILEAFFNPLVEKLKAYFLIGGMPSVVLRRISEKNFRS